MHAGSFNDRFTINDPFDKLATSISQFGSLDLFLVGIPNSQSKVLINRTVAQRSGASPLPHRQLRPLRRGRPADGDLMWITDAYVETSNFPESDRVNRISYSATPSRRSPKTPAPAP